jgi:hypothetical protein
MPVVPTVLFTLCGFATLGYATTILGLGLWVIAPALMLVIVGGSLRLTQLSEIAKAAAMAAAALAAIFVVISLAVAAIRGTVDELRATAPLIVGLACLSVLGMLVGRAPPAPDEDD